MFEAEEVGQAVFADALGAGRVQQHAIDTGEMRRLIAERGACQYVPFPAVRAGTVEVGHLGQDTRRRPGEQAGQRGNRLGRLVCSGTAEVPVVDQERSGQAEEGLDGEECDLPSGRNWPSSHEFAELLPRFTDRQVPDSRQVRPYGEITLARSPQEDFFLVAISLELLRTHLAPLIYSTRVDYGFPQATLFSPAAADTWYLKGQRFLLYLVWRSGKPTGPAGRGHDLAW